MVEPAIDLGVFLAIASSFRNKAIPEDVVAIGEIGLTGELRFLAIISKTVLPRQKNSVLSVVLYRRTTEKNWLNLKRFR